MVTVLVGEQETLRYRSRAWSHGPPENDAFLGKIIDW
jgi:hypothetical protein